MWALALLIELDPHKDREKLTRVGTEPMTFRFDHRYYTDRATRFDGTGQERVVENKDVNCNCLQLQIGNHAKAIGFENLHFGSKIKIQQNVKIHSTNHLQLICEKNPL